MKRLFVISHYIALVSIPVVFVLLPCVIPPCAVAAIYTCPDGQGGVVFKNELCEGTWAMPAAPPSRPTPLRSPVATPRSSVPRRPPDPVVPQKASAPSRLQSCAVAFERCDAQCGKHTAPMSVDAIKARGSCVAGCSRQHEKCDSGK
jgi:hypothetical protein